MSFDTKGWEWEIDTSALQGIAFTVLRVAESMGVTNYQCVWGIHDNGKNRHIHFVVNPVNIKTKKILHYNLYQWERFLKLLAIELYMLNRIALIGVQAYWKMKK